MVRVSREHISICLVPPCPYAHTRVALFAPQSPRQTKRVLRVATGALLNPRQYGEKLATLILDIQAATLSVATPFGARNTITSSGL